HWRLLSACLFNAGRLCACDAAVESPLIEGIWSACEQPATAIVTVASAADRRTPATRCLMRALHCGGVSRLRPDRSGPRQTTGKSAPPGKLHTRVAGHGSSA